MALSMGLKRYFSDKPCPRGHIAQRTIHGRCVECCRARDQKYGQTDAAKAKDLERNRAKRIAERIARLMDPTTAKQHSRPNRYSTPEAAINRRMSGGILHALDRGKGGRSWKSMVGYDLAQLCAHLERQFTRGMTWENRGKWHIDHIQPLASFCFTSANDPEFKAAWALTNLRPLWKEKNISKGAKRLFLL
jgi:hypothetical protein